MTGSARRRAKIALRRPILSGPPDLGVLVRNAKTPVKGRFQRGGRLAWFEPHLPEIRTSRANAAVRKCRGGPQARKDSRSTRYPARQPWGTLTSSPRLPHCPVPWPDAWAARSRTKQPRPSSVILRVQLSAVTSTHPGASQICRTRRLSGDRVACVRMSGLYGKVSV